MAAKKKPVPQTDRSHVEKIVADAEPEIRKIARKKGAGKKARPKDPTSDSALAASDTPSATVPAEDEQSPDPTPSTAKGGSSTTAKMSPTDTAIPETIVPDNKNAPHRSSSSGVMLPTEINNSGLNAFRESIPGYYLQYIAGTMEREESEEMSLGSILHSLILEPDGWDEKYTICEDCDRRTAAGKAIWAEAVATGKPIIRRKHVEAAKVILDNIIKHKEGRLIFDSAGTREQTLRWKCRRTSVGCYGTPDLIDESKSVGNPNWIMDLKTTGRLLYEWERHSAEYGYHRQAAMYTDGCLNRAEQIMFKPWDIPFFHLVAQVVPPYEVAVFQFRPEAIQTGLEELDSLKTEWKWCIDNNSWESRHTKKVHRLGLPAFYGRTEL